MFFPSLTVPPDPPFPHPQRSAFCYHAGTQFLTAHASFSLMMENSLQMINPRVSLPSWDYMIDAATYGPL